MQMLDIAIIMGYLVLVIVIGFWISRRASQNLDTYFLGGKSVHWSLLGISNATSMNDLSGTMWLVFVVFVYGMKGLWMPWVWVTFNQVFYMVYLSIWIRRSNVLTGAEWISTRFGNGIGGNLCHISVVFFAFISVIGFLSYSFQGVGKFAAVFLPWDWSPHMYAIILMSITTLYVILGGMYSVVLTDIVQFIIMTITSVVIGAIAIMRISPEMLRAAVPEGWLNLWFGWRLNLDWSAVIPSVNSQIARDGYELFTIFIGMVLFKGILVSMAGPGPNYDMQRVLAARDAKSAALMSGVVNFAILPRWIMTPAIAIIALVFFRPQLLAMGSNIDFEQILPYVIAEFLPVGLIGLFIAGLLAAFMSTFDSTVNAGAAYLVNDIYKKYFRPQAPEKRYIAISYGVSIALVALGIGFGLMSSSIHRITEWLVFGLYGGYTAPNVLKWHWWRLNAFGYFGGMIGGVVAALFLPLLFPSLSAVNSFPLILAIGTLASISISLATPPDPEEVLISFYKSVRPWGFWQPIHVKAVAQDPNFVNDSCFRRDMVNVGVGIIWQLALRLIPVYLVLRLFGNLAAWLVVALLTSWFLKTNWYDRLQKD
ncbi:MAG TPA: Na+:solute symporter [bacterium]|nr:Na+:solute symporter [bacterium]HNT66096.1 Na+:solute symporter [bacterium]HOX87305.1 Na+:solute symporter [bacterium]HPG46766.1 Na+:solute symporter [bacterium]HPM98904.1 Na+:solute symporter [bacterium]